MVECPECGQHVKGSKCRCGWAVPKAQPVDGKLAHDPMYGCCDWIAGGRCHYPAVFGHGVGGPWYCKSHEWCHDPVAGSQIVEQSHSEIPRPDYSYEACRNASLRNVVEQSAAFSSIGEKKPA